MNRTCIIFGLLLFSALAGLSQPGGNAGGAASVDAPRPISAGGVPVDKTWQINSNVDDAEQKVGGSFSNSSSDLELGFDGSEQVVGLIFRNVDIPQGSTITSATVWFTSRHNDSGQCDLLIQCEDADTAGSMGSGDLEDIMNNTGGRARTTSIAFSFPDWTAGGDQKDDDTRTGNFASSLQEVTDRAGWVSGNDIMVLVAVDPYDSGASSRRRNARSHNNSAAKAAILEVTYLQ